MKPYEDMTREELIALLQQRDKQAGSLENAPPIQSGVKPPHSTMRAHFVQPEFKKEWPHAPLHRLTAGGVYMVTGGTLHKAHYFGDDEPLDIVEDALLSLAKRYGWQLEAWAVFPNHYHFIGHAPSDPFALKNFVSHLHTQTATELNRREGTEGRMVWYNFWDTQLTYERSYLARLNYVHQNAVRHGLVQVANQYRWCSAAWFERTASLRRSRPSTGSRSTA